MGNELGTGISPGVVQGGLRSGRCRTQAEIVRTGKTNAVVNACPETSLHPSPIAATNVYILAFGETPATFLSRLSPLHPCSRLSSS